jgi:hypothetical protein
MLTFFLPVIGFYYLQFKYYTRPLHNKDAHSQNTQGSYSANEIKLGELYIRLRNCKMLNMMEGQCADYAAIHAAKRGPLPYPSCASAPLKRGRDPPCGEAVTIVGGCPYTGR